jgi:AsmA protein
MVEMAPLASAQSGPPGKRMRRAIGIVGVLFVAAALVATAAPWLFSTLALRDAIVAQIRQMTGLVALSQGQAVFVVLPQPHISIDDVSLADPSGSLRIDARYLKGYLRVAPLLRGRLEIAWVALGQPNMDIDLDGRPLPSDSAIGSAANAKPASPQAASADEARLGYVSLVDGRARLKNKFSASDLLIEDINVKLDWRKLGGAASVTGRARFRGEPAEIAARIARPIDLLRGEQSTVTLQIQSGALSLSTHGSLTGAPRPQYNGRIVASASSLRKLVQLSGLRVRFPGPFDDFSLTCEVGASPSSATFSDLRLRLDGNDFEGTLAVQSAASGLVLSGTLATNVLSLRPFLSGRPALVGRDGQWSREPFDPKELSLADLDLRISAARMILPRMEIKDAAFSVMNRNGRLEFTLAEAKAYQGAIKGRASFAMTDAGLAFRASGALSKVSIGALASSAFGASRLAGSANGGASIEGVGSSMSELMRGLDGQAHIAIARGELGGIDLDQALRRIDKSPLAVVADLHRGGTAFESASFGLRIAKGVAEIEEGAVQSPSVHLDFGGTADLAERALNLRAVATPAGAADASGREAPQFRFELIGSWDDLIFIPDVRSLIRHSGAAAPLFPQKPAAVKPPAPDPEGAGSGAEDAGSGREGQE